MNDVDQRAERAVVRYGDHITAYCARRLPPEPASEAASEVMAVTWRRREVLPDEPATLPWMYGVAKKVVQGQRRAERRWMARSERAAATAIRDDESTEWAAMRAEEERQVRQALAGLSSSDREILRLAAWEGLSNRQIADVLNLTTAATDQRLSRAKRRLADEFNRITSGRGGRR
jgi:RNA polymerase sigma-70 factor (ECF subfamily)